MIGLRKIFLMAGPVLALATHGFAEGTYLTGTDLDMLCGDHDSNSDRDLLCSTYVHGFLDGLNIGATLPKKRLRYCPPRDLTVPQAKLVIEKYLRDHPTELKLDAGTIAARAFLAAYPCPGQTNSH